MTLEREAWALERQNKYKRIVLLLLLRQMQIDASHGENRSQGEKRDQSIVMDEVC